jgi:hypothetical protein
MTETAAQRLLHRTSRIRLRLTRRQARRCYGLLRSAGDVWAWLLDSSRQRRQQGKPVISGTFAIDSHRVRLPVARGQPALWVRLTRPLPYPAEQVREVTLLADGGRLWLMVTAAVPVQPHDVDPSRLAGAEGWLHLQISRPDKPRPHGERRRLGSALPPLAATAVAPHSSSAGPPRQGRAGGDCCAAGERAGHLLHLPSLPATGR